MKPPGAPAPRWPEKSTAPQPGTQPGPRGPRWSRAWCCDLGYCPSPDRATSRSCPTRSGFQGACRHHWRPSALGSPRSSRADRTPESQPDPHPWRSLPPPSPQRIPICGTPCSSMSQPTRPPIRVRATLPKPSMHHLLCTRSPGQYTTTAHAHQRLDIRLSVFDRIGACEIPLFRIRMQRA